MKIWTIGHSTRSFDEFVALLKHYGVKQVADVRTIPRSRHNPQFEQSALEQTLPAAGIAYRHFPALGGLRKVSPGSPNCGWKNAAFRGYADYMQTPEFAAGIDELLAWARQAPTAVMCAEAVPWRCHRTLLADALQVRGHAVIEIIDLESSRPHPLTSFAKVNGTDIIYPSPQPELPL